MTPMTGRAWEEQHAMHDVKLPGAVVHACPPGDTGVMPCCGKTPFEVQLDDRLTEDPTLVTCDRQAEQQPIRVVTTGYQETAEQVAKLVGTTGAYRFALLWTHPEFPDPDRPAVPPEGVAVTWSAIACFDRRADKTAIELGIDRHLVHALRGRAVIAASCYGLDYANVIACACAELMRTLGANVDTAGGTPAQVVATPRAAMLEALNG